MEAAVFLSRSFLIVIVIVLPLLPKEITITIEAKKGRKRLIRRLRLRLRPRKRGISQLQAGRSGNVPAIVEIEVVLKFHLGGL